MKKIILFTIILLTITSCTENQRARQFGGKETISLLPGEKLVNVTWKQDDLWILTREFTKKDTIDIYLFKEKSSFELMEGEITINESIFNQ